MLRKVLTVGTDNILSPEAELSVFGEYESVTANDTKNAINILRSYSGQISAVAANAGDGGCELLKTLRSSPEYANTPVLILTDIPKYEQQAILLGANDCILLPCPPEYIRNRLKNIIFLSESAVANALINQRQSDEQLRFLNNTAHDLLGETDINEAVNSILNDMLNYFNGNRAYVIEIDNENENANNTYEVCAPGVEPEIELLQNVPLDAVPFWLNAFDNKEYIIIDDIDTLDESRREERELLKTQNINSLIAVPLLHSGELIGFIGIDDPSENKMNIDRLVALGDYVSVLLIRRDLTAKIENDHEMMAKLMKDTPGGFARIIVTKQRSAKLEYANDGFCKLVSMSHEEVYSLYGVNALDALNPDDAQSVYDTITHSVLNNNSFSLRTRLKYGDNGYVWVLVYGRLVKNENGDSFLNMYFTDLSEEKKLEAQREELLKNLPGGAGIYDLYPDGRLERVYLNDGYFSLVEVSKTERDEYLSRPVSDFVHPDDLVPMTEELHNAVNESRTTAIVMRVLSGSGDYKWLGTRANVAIRTDEKLTLYVSFSDVDRLKKTQLKLEESRRAIEIATLNSDMAFWLYNLDTKQLTQSFQDASPMGYPMILDNIPERFCSTNDIFPDDAQEHYAMYQKLIDGAEKAECTVRALNHSTGKYEWRHIVYSLLTDTEGNTRTAIGFATNAELEQENRQRYERELQLRREMIKNSVFSLQLNLTSGTIEEYSSNYSNSLNITPGTHITEELHEKIISASAPEDKQKVNDAFSVKSLLSAYYMGETAISRIYRSKLGNSGLRWIETTATLMQRPDSEDILALIYCVNIDSEKKDRLAVESIMDEEIEYVVVLTVAKGKAHFVRMNNLSTSLDSDQPFEYNKVFGEMINSEVMSEDRELCDSFFYTDKLQAALENEDVIKITYRIKGRNGKILRKKTRAFYLDESHEEIILIRRDITDLYEEEQRQKQALQKAVDRANDANRAKSDFLSRMSHDIRTPLNAVIGMVDLAKGENNPPQTNEYLNNIDTSSHFLLGLINDILDLSRIESGKIKLHEEILTLEEFTRSITTVILPMTEAKNIQFKLELSCCLQRFFTDKLRFNQIFFNLLSNAAKFTNEGGTVELTAQRIPERAGKTGTRFTVRDSGRGMSEEFLNILFEPFSQEVCDGNPVVQGTGLGLAIVKNLVDAMDGEISVTSTLGVGTCFTVDLYTAEAPPVDTADIANPINHESLKGMRILLVEDNEMNIIVAQKLLEREGCVVDVARNGLEAVEAFSKAAPYTYKAILMDVRMPVMNGIEATKKIRSLDKADSQTIPIIAMTADAFTEDRNKTHEAGMNAHLAKPINPKNMYDTILQYAHIS